MNSRTTRGIGVTLLLACVVATAGCAGSPTSTPAAAPPPTESADALPVGMPNPPVGAFAASVERVVDGDTFVARRDGRRVRVRLIGIDAPESVKPDSPVECYGPEASAFLSALLPPGTRLRAAYQGAQHTDPNGRDLWDTWLADGRFVQAVLVQSGAVEARSYRPQVAHAPYLARVEAVAAEELVGLHGACGRSRS